MFAVRTWGGFVPAAWGVRLAGRRGRFRSLEIGWGCAGDVRNAQESGPRRRAQSQHPGQPNLWPLCGGARSLGRVASARPKPREIAGIFDPARPPPENSPDSRTSWRSGQSSANPPLCPNSLIYGKIPGIRADSGAAGLAIGPDSLACTRTCAPRSLEPGTGNFVPRSRDSHSRDPLRKAPDQLEKPVLGPTH